MLEKILLAEEYRQIPENIVPKIEKVLNETSEKYFNLSALYETFKRDQGDLLEDLQTKLTQEVEKRENLQLELDRKCKEFDELDAKVGALQKQNSQLKNDLARHENEARTYRCQRDDIADEKSSLQSILNRRNNELENLKSDYDFLNEKYKSETQSRIEAQSKLSEIKITKIELDYKEKLLETEKDNLLKQIELLTNDVTKHELEKKSLKKEYNSQLEGVRHELLQSNKKIEMLLENEKTYDNTIKQLNEKIEELNNRLTGRSEIENELRNKYIAEIKSQTNLANVYKENAEQSSKKAEELASTAKNLQKLLNEAKLQYEDLEKQFAVNEITYKEHLQKKNDTIAALKKELTDANNLIEALKQKNLTDTLESLSPHAAAACNMIRKGLTLTQIYTEYASVSEQLLIKTHENEQLQNTFKAFIEELEGKAHVIMKRNEDYAEAMSTIEKLSQTYGQLELEYGVVKEKCVDAERNVARLTRDNERLHKTISDLSRQVCFLLKEIEESRGGEILINPISDTSSCLNSSDVISKKLVTFHDIRELQENNQKLLLAIRDLSEEYEKAEMKLKEFNKEELENKIADLERTLIEKEDALNRREKVMHMMENQVKAYKGAIDVPILDTGIMKAASVQTNNADVEITRCNELQKELNSKTEQLSSLKRELQQCREERSISEKTMLESLSKSEKSYEKLSNDYKTLIGRAENAEEKCNRLKSTIGSLESKITILENKCNTDSCTIREYEQTVNVLREEAMAALSALTRNEIMLENAKRECAMLRETEARIRAERDVLKQDKQNMPFLLSNIESIKTSLERSECEWKARLEEKLDVSEKECRALRRRLQDEQDRFNEKITFLEQSVENAKQRLEEEKKSNVDLSNLVESLKKDVEEGVKVIDELKNKLKHSSSETVAEKELYVKSLQNKYQQALKDVEHQKELLEQAKKETAEIAKISKNFEDLICAEREAHQQYKKQMETRLSEMAGELAGLQKQNVLLQERVNELSNLNETSMINLNDELLEERRKYSSTAEEVNNLREYLTAAQNELQEAKDELKEALKKQEAAENKYMDERLQHNEDIKKLKSHYDTVMTLKNDLARLTDERDAATAKAEFNMRNWLEEQRKNREEMEAQNLRMKELMQQNEHLFNEIQDLGLKLSVKLSHGATEQERTCLSEAGERNSDNLLQVINYLKREKNLATSRLEALLSENRRLKAEIDSIKGQFEETKSLLEAELQKTDIANTTAIKHAELVNKVQMLNLLNDSNRVLREERDRYAAELGQVKEKLEKIENETLIPLRNENKQMAMQLETLQTENIGLQKECTRWRTRVIEMTEKMNKNNAEDLQKSLNVERDAHNKTLEDLRAVKQEKSKLEDQMKKLQIVHNRISSLEKEKNEYQKELNDEKAKNAKLNQDFEELQKTLMAHESVINELKSSNIQVKTIARKYKTQCQELTKQMEEVKSKPLEVTVPVEIVQASSPAEIPAQEQDRLRQEGRQQIEAEMNDRIKQLSEQITTNEGEIDRLKTEKKALEVRSTDIVQQAKARIQSLVNEVKKLQVKARKVDSCEERIKLIEASRDEGIARQNVIKSTYENRISKLEKEKTENQTERDRLTREVEILSQRVTTLQRQLHAQQGVKSATNSGPDKGTVEPPTANIKPMAGPSSSVAKSQQNQQSVAVTPWRSANETPFASIRPMSMQTRTAAVLPTSQTSCSASQSTVLVPPQQQHVDTSTNAPSIVEAFSSSPSSSSHTDYNMPSTSSSVSHTSVRQVVVTPTPQTSHSAESTQDMEAECGNQELQTSLSGQPVSQNQAGMSHLMTTPSVSQSQTPTVALVLPRIDLQNLPAGMHNVAEQSVASSQTAPSLVSASNQTDSSNLAKRTDTYYQADGEDSNPGQVSASNQHSQQAIVASSIETAPEQSIVIASSQQNDINVSEPSVASSNANSSNTVTTTQAGLKRSREEGESSKSTEVNSVQPQTKRSRRIETVHEDIFRNDIDEASNTDMLLRYGNIDVEYQVPTSSQRDQEFDNLVIDSEAEDEPEEDEQAMPDDGIIGENDDVQEYVEDDEEVENEEVYEMEGYDREEQDTPMNRFSALEGPDIDEEGVQVHDQDNEVEILDEESNEVPNQSGRSDSPAMMARRNIDQQSSEATSSGNNLRAQSASITSNQSSVSSQYTRRPSTISPLNRQQNQQLLLSQAFEENAGDDSIVPSTPTLCVPRRTDGFGEAVSSPHVPSGGRFTFSESNPQAGRAGVAQMVSEGIDDTRMDLSQLEENSTGRSVPSTPLQSSPQGGLGIGEIERIEVGHSVEDSQPLNEELSSNSNNQSQQPTEDILLDNVPYQSDATENELEVVNESENVIDEPTDQSREENNDAVTSDGGPSEPPVAGTSQATQDDLEEGREAEAATKTPEVQSAPQQIPTTGGTARRSGARVGRPRTSRGHMWENAQISNTQDMAPGRGSSGRGRGNNQRGAYRRGNRRQRSWTPFARYN